MSEPRVDATRIREHVLRLGERHPPVDLDSTDYRVLDPAAVRDRFGGVLEYMARVEVEVERNVLELAVLLPDVSETDRLFYADVWGPQEERHGILLDTLGQHLGMPPVVANTGEVPARVRVLGALAHLPVVHEVVRLLYYLTGAATEKSAMLAYQAMSEGLGEMGEHAVKRTVVDAIKVQEPGHFAFYRLSAQEMVQSGAIAPWQLHLARLLRSRSYGLVGAATREQRTDFGGVVVELGLDEQLERNVRDISRLETQLLWAHREGLQVPEYALAAFRDAAAMYRERLAHRGGGRGGRRGGQALAA
ncbi:GTP-binding protein LepA [Kineococcus sp. T13]|uniref:GTP-binding protein LepA n=1 Tax=Kineococcus vitellinus TaxID=2696565 RepID=UPI0014126D09|nr:GTP-binding protein LepA [Kineococcus vitellinus]NAZ74663.1 GTP-binding protein LepA [Kineococcus vitellinus]